MMDNLRGEPGEKNESANYFNALREAGGFSVQPADRVVVVEDAGTEDSLGVAAYVRAVQSH